MSDVITIAGVVRTTDILLESLQIEQTLTHSDDNLQLIVSSGSKPVAGAEILITSGTDKLFGGIIDNVKDEQKKPGVYHYKCTARDYTYQADRKLVNESYGDQMLPSALAQSFSSAWLSGNLNGLYELSVSTGTGQLDLSGGSTVVCGMGQTVQFPVANATITITPTSGTPKDNLLHQVFTASQIFKDVVAKNCSGFTVLNVQNGAPDVEQISFPYKKPSECFKALADYVGWDWFCDYDRDFHFFDSDGTAVVPAPITVTSSAAVRRLDHNLDKEQLRNRVFVKGGVYLSDPYSYEIRADGVALAWNLLYPPVHNLSLKVTGATALVGREYVDTESTSFAYMINETDGILRACSWTTALASGTILIPLYQYEMPVIERQDDAASQAAVAAIEGGDGIYEYVITDESIITLEAARALAQQSLREFANPRVTGSFETYTTDPFAV